MKNAFFLSTLLFMVLFPSVKAQTGVNFQNMARENYEKNWSFGAGINVVDDSGEGLGGIRNPNLYWNFSRPFYVSAEYYLNNEFSFMAMFSLNAYKEGKQIDNAIVMDGEEAGYFAADLMAKYSFRDVLQTYKFDPYFTAGFGLSSFGAFMAEFTEYGETTIRDIKSTTDFTINAGFGFNYWISNTWGLNMNLMGKWNTGNDFKSNVKQYSLGAVYFLN